MSGADCGSGCTDCPTCRGEVQPDSPVVRDMAFGLAMANGPQSTDTFMGPLSVAQTVRDGVRQRSAAPDAGDDRMLRFVNGLSARIATGPGAQTDWESSRATPWNAMRVAPSNGPIPDRLALSGVSWNPGVLFSPSGDLGDAMGEGIWELIEKRYRELLNTKTQDQVTGHRCVFRDVAPQLFVPLGSGGGDEGREYGRRKRPKSERMCCVRDFGYPEWWKKTFAETDKGVKVGIDFKIHAEYVDGGWGVFVSGEGEAPAGDSDVTMKVCDCTCCEFEQYVDQHDGNGFVRECYLVDVSASGVGKGKSTAKFPSGVFPPPAPGENTIILCPGADRPIKTPPGMEQFVGEWSGNCIWDFIDHTGVEGDPEKMIGLRYHVTFIGKIVDACNARAVKRIESFTIDWTIGSGGAATDPWKSGAATGGVEMGSPGNWIAQPPELPH